MGVTAYSIIVSVLFYNLSLIVVYLLSRSGVIRAKYTSALLLFLTFLGAVRLLLPIDLNQAYVIRSYKVLPAVEDLLSKPLLGSLSLGRILLLIWVVGTTAFILRDVMKLRRDRLAAEQFEIVENERVSRIAEEFGKGFELKISPDVDLPYVAGFFHPAIYLPDTKLSDEEWRNIFRHETQHIRAHDEWKKLFFRAIRALFWWNPLVQMSEEDLNLLIELQCDDRVAGQGSLDEQEGYLRTMMELMKRYAFGDTPVGASGMVGREKEMKIRFEALLAPKTRWSRWMRIVILVVVVALFVASYTVVIQPARFPSEEEMSSYREGHTAYDISSDIIENADQFILYEDGKYRLFIDGTYVSDIDEAFLNDPYFNTTPIYGGK